MIKGLKRFWQYLWWEENHYCNEQHGDGRIGQLHKNNYVRQLGTSAFGEYQCSTCGHKTIIGPGAY